MLLTITSTSHPATDLGFLLAKHPEKTQSFELSFGRALVFYPVAGPDRCTFAMMLDVDPVGLVRRKEADAPSLFQYVTDRPYVSSSFTSVAIAKVLGSALNGRCAHDPALAEKRLDLEIEVAALPCRGGERLLRSLFEPLGYTVSATRSTLDPRFPEWGESPHFEVRLAGSQVLRDALQHLYVLVPVLDDAKHYWVGDDEGEKLLEKGATWLADHPERETITRRYLKHQRQLAREVLARLIDDEDPDIEEEVVRRAAQEEALEKKIRLNELRLGDVVAVLVEEGVRSVVDLGCGEGRLLAALLSARRDGEAAFSRMLGMDVSHRALEICRDRLKLDRLPEALRQRIELIQGSLTYRDARLAGFDGGALVEVIEHLDPPRLEALERVVFEFARPRVIVVTTPNREYNTLFPTLAAGAFRHRDHRFEWTREEFRAWAEDVCARREYRVRFAAVGPVDDRLGSPTQMAVFSR